MNKTNNVVYTLFIAQRDVKITSMYTCMMYNVCVSTYKHYGYGTQFL